MDNHSYLDVCKSLSLTARLSIALKLFEEYCRAYGVVNASTTEFLDYLWKWPSVVAGDITFTEWESNRPLLVNYGLGESSNDYLQTALSEANIEEHSFRVIVSSIVEILWSSFWGAPEDDLSLNSLSDLIQELDTDSKPDLTPFKNSKFIDNNGWGNSLSNEEIELWRSFHERT